jgi:RNA polymerase sigma factor (sigma-70 family)
MGVQAPVSARPNAAWRPLYSVLGDERLARLVSDGNKQAFAPLYERYYQQLYRYCRSIVHDDLDAQDALQSTFASAFAALRKSQRDAPLRPWLFRIAHNEAVSVIRRRRPTEDLSEASQQCGDSVEQQAGDRARFSLLLRDLRELPDRQRSALVMRELSGLSHEEIAIVLGTSVGAAKQTIFEARRSLSEFAEGRVMQCDEVRKVVSDADGRTLRSRRVRAHLEDCSCCAEFAAAIATRSADLRAISPALPASAAAAVLARSLGAGSSHGSGGAAGLAAGTAGKTAGAALATKAVASVVIVAAGTAGAVAGLGQITDSSHARAARAATPRAAHLVKTGAASTSAGLATSAIGPRGARADGRANASGQHGNRPATTAAKAKLTRLAGLSIPATGGRGAKVHGGAPAAAGTTGSTAPQQHAQGTSGGSPGAQQGASHAGGQSGSPARGTGSSPATVSAPGGTVSVKVPGGGASVSVPGGSASVSVPGGSASVSLPGASATVSAPNGSASVSVPGASASASVPNGSASVSVPGASATVSVPNGTTVSVGGQPTLHLPGLGSVLGPLGGSGSHTH